MAIAIFRQFPPIVFGTTFGFELEVAHNFVTIGQAYDNGDDELSPSGLIVQAKNGNPHTVVGSLYNLRVDATMDANTESTSYIFTRLSSVSVGTIDNGSTFNIIRVQDNPLTGQNQFITAGAATSINLSNTVITNATASGNNGPLPATPPWQTTNVGNYFDLFPGEANAYINLREKTPKVEFSGVNNEKGVTPQSWTTRKDFKPLKFEFAANGDILDVVDWRSNTTIGVIRNYTYKPVNVPEVLSSNTLANFSVNFHILNDLDVSKELLILTIGEARRAYSDSLDPIYKESYGQPTVVKGVVDSTLESGPTGALPLPSVSGMQVHYLGKLPTEEEAEAAKQNMVKPATTADVNKSLDNFIQIINVKTKPLANVETIDTTGEVITVQPEMLQTDVANVIANTLINTIQTDFKVDDTVIQSLGETAPVLNFYLGEIQPVPVSPETIQARVKEIVGSTSTLAADIGVKLNIDTESNT